MIVGTYPIALGEDKPIIKILDASGNELDNTLENGTYISFGTLPRGYSSWVDIYIVEELGINVYNATLTGIESVNQLGDAENTYQDLSAQYGVNLGTDNWTALPITLGTISKGCPVRVRIRYTADDDMELGIKVFGIQVDGDWVG